MTFSHDVIHHIGGECDSNKNTTQRILMLFESRQIRASGATNGAYGRVQKGILERYLHDDTIFVSAVPAESRIPRFLLNDLVRYWRTMCVDFACKEWEQGSEKWALRNVKLRMSRKLLFVSGLFVLFSCFKNKELTSCPAADRGQYILRMQQHLMPFLALNPVERLVWGLCAINSEDIAIRLLDLYDQFLDWINDPDNRKHLCGLSPAKAYEDRDFLRLRDLSHEFQAGLTEAFFQRESALREFTIKFGVF